jgi:AraC-like DNA-binding protein
MLAAVSSQMALGPEQILVARHNDASAAWEMARRAPHPALAGQVQGYCGYRERTAQPVRRREVANGWVALILSFGEPLHIVTMTNSPRPVGTVRSFVAGLHEGYAVTEHHGRQHGIQINLTPLGAYRLLGVPMSEVANQVVEIEALRGREIDELTERLASASDWTEQFVLIDRVLCGWLDRGPAADASVAWAWTQLERSHGQATIGGLASEIGWSRRHFASRFREQVGLGPKPTGRVLRFRNAVELLQRGRLRTIADVAAAAGYADHSHLVREFHSLAGCAPSELVAARMPDGGVAG